MIVIFEMAVDAETGSQRGCEQAAAGGCAYEGEGGEGELHRSRSGALVDHDVDAIVFHRRVEILFDGVAQSVNLVDEEHIVFIERGKNARKIARLVEHGA